ncbi:proton-conducting transporter transmembrane domain-containing protein [Thermococcus peptonophilus]|uniref:Cation:proton antiporter n=1 Tax=Thermococcus peptonophilus TaxID=53952 RepID=A0A142CX60_9EURY|nr:proton-conducting transporter membrane subunit [Thermococcus peptonophilus]AMQ19362.1 cation:proton antiporter [Thermococcus peptonophilus]
MEVGIVPVIPLGFAFFLPFIAFATGKNRKVVIAYALTAQTVAFLAGIKLFKMAYSSNEPLVYAFGNWIAPIGIVFEVDRLSATLVLTATFGFLMAGIYSARFIREHGLEFFYTFLLGLEAGTLGAFMTGDAFNLFVMLEVLGASAYAIVGFYRNRSESIEGAFKYGISGAVATSLYFLALGFLYASLGTVNMADLSAKFHGIDFPITVKVFGDPTLALGIFFALTISMVLVKSAIFPGHYWLPDAYQGAPIPVGAVLSGFVEVVGIYALMRFLYTVFQGVSFSGWLSLVFFTLGTATAFLGSLMMLVQRDVKRVIAYSTILHMGYLFMTLGVGTELAVLAINFHIVNHAIAKMLLFFTVGAFIYRTGKTKIDELSGVGKKMPVTTFLFGIATLSLVGVPPLNVFFSKMLIFDALMQKSVWLASVVIITSAIAAWAYFKLFITLWRGKPVEGHGHHGENEHEEEKHNLGIEGGEVWTLTSVNLILGLLVVLFGILAPVLIDSYFHGAAVQAMDYKSYIEAVRKLAETVLLNA